MPRSSRSSAQSSATSVTSFATSYTAASCATERSRLSNRSSKIGSARYRKHDNGLLEKKLQQRARAAVKVPNLGLRNGSANKRRLSERNLKEHQKKLSERSSKSRSQRGDDERSDLSSGFFERFLQEQRATLTAKGAGQPRMQPQAEPETEDATAETKDEVSTPADGAEALDTTATLSVANEPATTDRQHARGGLAQLDVAIGASRQSLHHTEGELLRQAAGSSSSRGHSARSTGRRKYHHPVSEDPICRVYPVHHAAEKVKVVEEKKQERKHTARSSSGAAAQAGGQGGYKAVRGFKSGPDVLRRPRATGYNIHMTMEEAQEVLSQRSHNNREDKENSSARSENGGRGGGDDDARSQRSSLCSAATGATANGGFKPSKRMFERRRTRSGSVAAAIGIGSEGMFRFGGDAGACSGSGSGARTTAQALGGWAHPKEMELMLREKCSEHGSYHNNLKTDISEYAEARIKFGSIHNVV